MGAIHFYTNSNCKTCSFPAKPHISLARQKRLPTSYHPLPSAAPPLTGRAMVSTNKDGIGVDPHDLEPIFEHKRSLRSKVRKALKNMDPIQRSQEDNAIQNTVVDSSWFKASTSVCAYISSPSLLEVDTSRVISEVLSCPAKERKKLYVPRVMDRNSNMKMLMISSVDDLIEKSMNISEPALVDSDGNQREDAMQASDPVDLIILPGNRLHSPIRCFLNNEEFGLAFDKSGSRLGRSGGYYDLFLKNYQELTRKNRWKQPLLVALSYSVQIIEEGAIPVTPFDIPVHSDKRRCFGEM